MKNILWICALLLAASGVSAMEIGHYAAGSFGPRDLLSPSRGTTTITPGYIGYHTSTIKNSKGKNATDGLVNVDINIGQGTLIMGYSPEMDLLGANFSFMAIPGYGETGINAYLTHHDNISGGKTKKAWMDTELIPINLTWIRSEYGAISAQYGVWVPTGSYKSHRALNNGLGYWSHDFRLVGSWFPLGTPKALISFSTLYEWNMKKKGIDIKPGNRLVFEAGASYEFNPHLLLGGLLTANYEITHTSGSAATDDGKDRVYSWGVEFIIPIKQVSFIIRALKEFEARDRSQGEFLYGFVTYQF